MTVDDVHEFASVFDEYLLNRREYALVLDAPPNRMPKVAAIKLMAKWIKERESDLARYNQGCAFVLGSPVVRGAFKAVLHMQPMPMPYSVEPNLEAARNWCRARLHRGVVTAGVT
jgi:hypothetical protein